MKALYLGLVFGVGFGFGGGCQSDSERCQDMIRRLCGAQMVAEVPPATVAQYGRELIDSCQEHVNELRIAAGVGDIQCVADMARVLRQYTRRH